MSVFDTSCEEESRISLIFILFSWAENLILTADHRTVKLADFGLAREETLTEMMTAETGTYRWMAPEVNLKKNYGVQEFSFYGSWSCYSI